MTAGEIDPAVALAAQFYEPLQVADCGSRRVGWESEAAHHLRLRALVEALGPLECLESVIDVGCGEGHLAGLLRAGGFVGAYLGEDLLEVMTARARSAFPEERFLTRNGFHDGASADAIVCCGALNTAIDHDHQAAAEAVLASLWSRTQGVLVVDFSTVEPHSEAHGQRGLDLERMWRCARSLTPLVRVREDLIVGEAQLALYRHQRPSLETLLPEASWAIGRARLLLAGRHPAAARETLAGCESEEAACWRALAELRLGRERDAEDTLRGLVGHAGVGGRALLHLGVLLLSTRRPEEAQDALVSASERGGTSADEARVLLASLAQHAGDNLEAQRWASGIVDPWIRREALDA